MTNLKIFKTPSVQKHEPFFVNVDKSSENGDQSSKTTLIGCTSSSELVLPMTTPGQSDGNFSAIGLQNVVGVRSSHCSTQSSDKKNYLASSQTAEKTTSMNNATERHHEFLRSSVPDHEVILIFKISVIVKNSSPLRLSANCRSYSLNHKLTVLFISNLQR